MATQGAGGLGVSACAVTREVGASRTIVPDGVPERPAPARALGVDEVLDLREPPTPASRVGRVRPLTDKMG